MKELLKNKKTILIILILLIAFITTETILIKSKNNTTKSHAVSYLELGKDTTLKKQDYVNIKGNNNPTIKLVTIIDSRCKEDDKTCALANQIEYTFIYKTTKKEIKFALGTKKNTTYEADIYKITLVKGDTKEATIKVEENK